MARPWPKKSVWPYVAKSGRKSYTVGFYDHDKRERRRTFPSVRRARAWMDNYVDRGAPGSRQPAKVPAGPRREGGQRSRRPHDRADTEALSGGGRAPTQRGRRSTPDIRPLQVGLNCHLLGKPRHQAGNRRKLPPAEYAVAIAKTQASAFNEPLAPRAWREQMREAGVPAQTRVHAWRVSSSALSWAARSPFVPEIQTNGCKLAREPVVSRRRSARTGGTGYTPVVRARPLPSWALSPQAVEAIRAQMLLCPARRKAILAHRDRLRLSHE